MGQFKNISGRKFFRWTAIKKTKTYNRHSYWLCRCDCGNEKELTLGSLMSEKSKSCGCYQIEKAQTHKMSYTKEYGIWKGIKERCEDVNSTCYSRYGGRGITMCKIWSGSFEVFFKDMGYRPSPKHSVDRIDNNKGYSKENCRWATSKEQQNNRRNNRYIDYNDIRKTVSQWSETLGISHGAIMARLRLGWNAKDIIETPIYKPIKHFPPTRQKNG